MRDNRKITDAGGFHADASILQAWRGHCVAQDTLVREMCDTTFRAARQ
jgi:hypothetical protein